MAHNNHASYTRIGFTVFVGAIAVVLTLIYLGGLRGRGDEMLVETFYDKPVSGLSVGSAVNFRGVKVGEVREISFVGTKYEVVGAENSRIYILMALNARNLGVDDMTQAEAKEWFANLVKTFGMRATVTTSGITGLSRVELNFHRPERLMESREISWKPIYAFVPPQESLLDNISDAATKVLNQINQMDLSEAWSNIAASVDSLARTMGAVQTMLETRQDDIDRMLDNLSETAESVKEMISELKHNPSLILRDRRPTRLEETED